MTLDQMRYFLEVARTEHVGRAALALHVSPSTVSHAVSNIEAELGRALLEAKGRHVRLTEAGRAMRDRVAAVLFEVEALKGDLGGASFSERRHLRLAATQMLSAALLVPAWHTVSRQQGFATVDLLAGRSADIVNAALEGELDLGLCFSPVPHPDLSVETLAQGHLRLMVHREHPLVGLTASQVLKRVSAFPCVMPKPLAGVDVCEVHPVLSQHGLNIEAQVRYDSMETVGALLNDRRSFSLVPEICRRWMGPQLVLLAAPKSWSAPFTLAAIRQRKRMSSPVVGGLIDAVRRLL
jgi:LysR family transcriptional regulator, cyn operon transcriptional activator